MRIVTWESLQKASLPGLAIPFESAADKGIAGSTPAASNFASLNHSFYLERDKFAVSDTEWLQIHSRNHSGIFLIKRIKTLFNDVKSEELRYWIFNLFHLAARNSLLSFDFLPLHWFEIKNSHRESSQWGLISFLLFQCLHRPRHSLATIGTEFYLINFSFSPFINSQTVAHKKCRNSICSQRMKERRKKSYQFRAIKSKRFRGLSLSTMIP